MGSIVDFLELLKVGLEIELGRIEMLVTQQRLDDFDVGPVFQEMSGKATADSVAGERLEAGNLGVTAEHLCDASGCYGFAGASEEEGLLVLGGDLGSGFEVAFQDLFEPRAQRKISACPALAVDAL